MTISDDEPHSFEEIKKNLTIEDTIETCLFIHVNNFNQQSPLTKYINVKGSDIEKTYNFSEKKQFKIICENNFDFIETEKPIYKPGDKGSLY